MYIPTPEEFLTTEAPPSVWRRISVRLGALWRAWQNRRSVSSLLEFDDRMLRDIGLTRSDVTCALAGRSADDPSMRLALIREEKRMARRGGVSLPPMMPRSPTAKPRPIRFG